jgi:hypothetical protein
MTQSMSGVALDAFMPPLAPFVLLALLGTTFLLFVLFIASAVALAGKRRRTAKILAGSALAVSSIYATLLLGASLVSRERVLRPGEKKYFGEMDCHLAYSAEVFAASPDGRRIGVTVRTWFDPSTIASFRGNGPLTPNPRVVYLVDGSGHRRPPNAMEAESPAFAPLTRELRPGESYTTRFIFELPPDAGTLRFYLGDAPGFETLILNHENSPFHARIFFEVPPIASLLREGRS